MYESMAPAFTLVLVFMVSSVLSAAPIRLRDRACIFHLGNLPEKCRARETIFFERSPARAAPSRFFFQCFPK